VTSGIRIGTPAITTRGLVESDMEAVVDLIDKVIIMITNDIVIEQVESEVREMMRKRPLFIF
jgi:glycine hydroxymethyltransferase